MCLWALARLIAAEARPAKARGFNTTPSEYALRRLRHLQGLRRTASIGMRRTFQRPCMARTTGSARPRSASAPKCGPERAPRMSPGPAAVRPDGRIRAIPARPPRPAPACRSGTRHQPGVQRPRNGLTAETGHPHPEVVVADQPTGRRDPFQGRVARQHVTHGIEHCMQGRVMLFQAQNPPLPTSSQSGHNFSGGNGGGLPSIKSITHACRSWNS